MGLKGFNPQSAGFKVEIEQWKGLAEENCSCQRKKGDPEKEMYPFRSQPQ